MNIRHLITTKLLFLIPSQATSTIKSNFLHKFARNEKLTNNDVVELKTKINNSRKDIKLLLNEKNHHGFTPLQTAVGWNNKELVELYLRHGANPNVGSFKHKPIYWAVQGGNQDIARLIKEKTKKTLTIEEKDKLNLLAREKGYPKLFPSSFSKKEFPRNLLTVNSESNKPSKISLHEGAFTYKINLLIPFFILGMFFYNKNNINEKVDDEIIKGNEQNQQSEKRQDLEEDDFKQS